VCAISWVGNTLGRKDLGVQRYILYVYSSSHHTLKIESSNFLVTMWGSTSLPEDDSQWIKFWIQCIASGRNCLPIYGSTALCWVLARYLSFLTFYTVGRTPWTGDQPVARPLPAHRTAQTQKKRRQISIPRMGFESTIPVFVRAKSVSCLIPRGRCDRLTMELVRVICSQPVSGSHIEFTCMHRDRKKPYNPQQVSWFVY
jgi:hypothetical protein